MRRCCRREAIPGTKDLIGCWFYAETKAMNQSETATAVWSNGLYSATPSVILRAVKSGLSILMDTLFYPKVRVGFNS